MTMHRAISSIIVLFFSCTVVPACSDKPSKGGLSSSSSSGSGGSAGSAGEGTGGKATGGSGGMGGAASSGSGGMGGGSAGMGVGGGGGPVDVEPAPPCGIPAPIQLTVYANSNSEPASTVWNGSNYAVLHRDVIAGQAGVFLTFLSKSGVQQGQSKLLTQSNFPNSAYYYVRLIWNGSGYGVLWSFYSVGGSESLQFSQYDAMGNAIGSPTVIANGSTYYHDLVWTGTEYGLVWLTGNEVRFVRVSTAGTPIGTYVALGNGSNGSDDPPVMAWSGNEYGVAWRDTSTHIMFTRVNANGAKVIDPIDISQGPTNGAPAIVWGDGEYVLVRAAPLTSMASTGGRVLLRRISENGTPAPNDIEIKVLPEQSGAIISGRVDIVYNGISYAASWLSNEINQGGFEVFAARFSKSLQKFGNDIQVTSYGARNISLTYPAANYPQLIWNGQEYFVTWQDYIGQPNAWNSYGRAVCY